jgi:hypothetical protein
MMALVEFHIPEFTKAIEARIEDANMTLGGQCVTWAADQVRENKSVKTGNLINSLAYATPVFKSDVMVPGKTDGEPLKESVPRGSLFVGSNIAYAARVEFGFVGKDSLGRMYNQAPKPYLRAGILRQREKIIKFYEKVFRG